MFKLSERSLSKLVGVNPRLVKVVKRAIELTDVDFGVLEGVRTLVRQKELVRTGASKTLKSRHLDGMAVDLLAYVDGRVCWEIQVYDEIADAMKAAAKEFEIRVRWGGAWNVSDITKWEGSMESAMNYYIDYKRAMDQRPFIDGPHFEL